MVSPEESLQHGSVGRLAENMEAKIVDPVTGEALPPGQKGELWLRGPTIMNGDSFIEFELSVFSVIRQDNGFVC